MSFCLMPIPLLTFIFNKTSSPLPSLPPFQGLSEVAGNSDVVFLKVDVDDAQVSTHL